MNGGLRLSHADTTYHINRCGKCGRLLTKIEVVDRLEGRKPLPLCPCGSNTLRPSNPLWYEYLYPRVIWLAVQIVRGKCPAGVGV